MGMSLIERLRSGSCAQTRELLSDLADGELRARRDRRVRRHLLGCGPCRAARDSLARAVAELRRLSSVEPAAPSVADAVVARLREGEVQGAER